MNLDIRLENESDYREVEKLTRKAFWKDSKFKETGLGCDEHYLVHTLRSSEVFVKALDFVAVHNDLIVGNIMYSKAWVETTKGENYEVLTFGPLSVLPEYQKKGVGSALMIHSLAVAKVLGYKSVLFYGHPTYYPRFGFKESKVFGITTHQGKNFPAFMAMELIKGSLKTIEGSFHESALFDVDQMKAKAYDMNFGGIND